MSIAPQMCAIADVAAQKEAIRTATDKSLMARDLYTEQVVSQLTQSMKSAQEQAHKALLGYKSIGSLPDNKLAAVNGLSKLDAEISETMKSLRKDQTLMFRKSTEASFRSGVYRGIEEFAAAQMPFYKDLTPGGIDKLTTSVFTLIDTDALDFMANYNLVLAGDVHRELSDGIKKTILSGIATGKGVEGIVADMGKVIEDKESFRHAGSKVFSKAQYRMEVIARTEILRAHNQGRIKFHQQVGVQKLEWMTMEDERMCPICGGLDGKVFDTDKFPSQPAHPLCRCTSIVTWPLVICGGELGATAAAGAQASCILPPQAIEQQAKQKMEDEAKLKGAFDSGEIADLSTLTGKQLQTLAKQNGVSVARTKADFIKLLDAAEPGMHHGDLAGTALTAKIKQYNIGALRSKDDLVKLLADKQAVIKQAKALEEAAKKAAPQGGLQSLTTVQLKEMAKEQGISLNLTKDEVIKMLDQLEPHIDHYNYSGKTLMAAKQKWGIPPLKNKEQLAKALEKSAGAQMADQAKEQALQAGKQAAIKKAEQSLKDASEKVVIPTSPVDYGSFLESVKTAESELLKDSGLPGSVLEQHAKEIALKKLTFQKQVSAMNSVDLKELAKTSKVKHYQWSNKDDLITLFTETDSNKIAAAQSSIEAKHAKWLETQHAKWSEKHPGITKPVAVVHPAPTVVVPPLPEPKITESPIFARKGSEFDSVDAMWDENGKPSRFKFESKADIGGAHPKEFWLDDNGDKWMFKPADSVAGEFVAHGEAAAYKIERLINPDVIEVRTIKLNGRVGSIQRYRTDIKSDFADVAMEDLTSDEIAQVQRAHVIDWLIANHDGHCKQFLRAKDGKVYGIDKGQMFKFLGDDKLALDYHPNQAAGERMPFYNFVFEAAKKGEVKFDPSITMRYIREVEKISDDDYTALLRPYVDGRFGSSELKKKAFYDQALSRKHNLRSDFESYYGGVLHKPGFRFDDMPEKTAAGRIGKAEERIIEDARALGWQGKCIPLDESDIEDQNALIFTEKTARGENTVIKLKMRPEAEAAILEKLGKADHQVVKIGESLPEDDFSADILNAVKTVNTHEKDGNYNHSKIDKANARLAALRKLAKSDDPDVKAMAETYLVWMDKVGDGIAKAKGIPEKFTPYLKKQVSDVKKKGASGVTTRKTKASYTERSVNKGDLTMAKEGQSAKTMFGSKTIADGEQYEIDFGDGVKATYRPWGRTTDLHGKTNLYANSGEFEMTIPERLDAKTVDKALERMEKIGINAKLATPEDTEIMYLLKQSYVAKIDHDPDYVQMAAGLDQRSASKPERVQAMRAFWEKRLKVKDITKVPGYDPVGEYQLGYKDPSTRGGFRQQYRFDLSDEQLEKDMKGYSLFHGLTAGNTMPGFLEASLGNNGSMISTVEKLRAGVKVSGMSPESDMGSGGASYVFTRIRKTPVEGAPRGAGLYFKKRLLRRMDAVSYEGDAYGETKGDYVTENRRNTPKEWKSISKFGSNETILKNSVTLLDNLEYIVVGSARERTQVLGIFKTHGISVLPDGRKIEDVVIAK